MIVGVTPAAMEPLQPLVTFFAGHGYAAVVLALLLCSVGLPLPEDVTLIAGGIIAGLGYTNVHATFVCALAGVLGGDFIMFRLGRHFGHRVLEWPVIAHLLTPARYTTLQRHFARHGNRLLFAARFMPGLRSAIFITAGVTGVVSSRRFLLWDGTAALISVPVWVYLGYFGANNRQWLATWLHRGHTGLWVGAVALVVITCIYGWRRHQRQSADQSRDD